MLKTMSSYEVAMVFDVDPSTVRKWASKQAKYIEVPNKKSKNLPGAGRLEALPDPQALVDYITERRSRERAVTTIHVINFMKRTQRAWINSYVATHDTDKAYNNLMRMIQRFCDRHRFSKQKPHKMKRNQEELEELRDEFAEDFHRRYAAYGSNDVYNVDETAVYFDMPPRTIWSIRGGNSALSAGEKHSMRMTAVLTVRGDGVKLPVLFIMRGVPVPGGLIENREFSTFPSDHYYAVQKNAWMDAALWSFYLRHVLMEEIDTPSVIIVDNFDSHVSSFSRRFVERELGSTLCALPPNTTSHLQPLDVGVMAPFKSRLRDLWILEDAMEDEIVDVDDDGDDDESPTASMKRMMLIKRVIAAWGMITEREVREAFIKAIPPCIG
ncbi:hypothetical protein LEN26_017910 [Aphanomyces euteiches]|nr:hypothetical protein LEN26_017910 [Aphanomyces euteiches]